MNMLLELITKSAAMNEISNYIDELKKIDNIHMADISKSNIQIVKNDEELNNE